MEPTEDVPFIIYLINQFLDKFKECRQNSAEL